MTNLWLLKLKNVDVFFTDSNELFSGASKVYSNITPIQLLRRFSVPGTRYLNKFLQMPNGKYIPDVTTLNELKNKILNRK